MEIIYSPKFLQVYKKLPLQIKKLAEKKETIFRQNPFNPLLKTHPLSGKLKGYYSFSINYQYRLIFKFADESTIWFLNIGTHSIYK